MSYFPTVFKTKLICHKRKDIFLSVTKKNLPGIMKPVFYSEKGSYSFSLIFISVRSDCTKNVFADGPSAQTAEPTRNLCYCFGYKSPIMYDMIFD